MNAITVMLIVWGALTAVLVGLMIYRNTLSLHEDTQLFLESEQTEEEKEQQEIDRKMNRLTPWVRTLGALSCALLVATVGTFLYTGLSNH